MYQSGGRPWCKRFQASPVPSCVGILISNCLDLTSRYKPTSAPQAMSYLSNNLAPKAMQQAMGIIESRKIKSQQVRQAREPDARLWVAKLHRKIITW